MTKLGVTVMADYSNEYEVSLDSRFDTSAEHEEHLEKKRVLGNKSKLLCSLKKTTLYMQKKQGHPAKIIDLKYSHLVRKVASDVTGTQFEIFEKKKTHVFICPTSESCTAWVKALQAAMALKDSGQYSSDHNTYTPENVYESNVYEVCDPMLSHLPKEIPETFPQTSEYNEPVDIQSVSGVEGMEGEYWEVGDNQGKLDKSQPTLQAVDASLSQNHSEQIYEESKETSTDELYTDTDSLSQTNSSSAATQIVSRPAQRASTTAAQDDVYYDDVSSDAFSDPVKDVQPTNHCPQESPSADEDDCPFQALLDVLSDRNSPIPDYIHPLTKEDWKPIEDFRQFLTSNQEYCQVPYSFVPISEDPVTSLKSYLETHKDIVFRKSGHS